MKKHPYLFLESDSRFGWEKMDAYEWCGTVLVTQYKIIELKNGKNRVSFQGGRMTMDTMLKTKSVIIPYGLCYVSEALTDMLPQDLIKMCLFYYLKPKLSYYDDPCDSTHFK